MVTASTQGAGSTTQADAAAPMVAETPAAAPASAPESKSKAWYERLSLRGYTQMRYNAFLSGDDSAPAGVSRLRSVHDSSISDRGSFSLRRARLVLQGDISAFDLFCMLLQRDGIVQLVYKHAISTVQPTHPLDLSGEGDDAEPD